MKNINNDIIIHDYDFDDDLIASAISNKKLFLRCYQPDKTMIVLGKSSRPDIELNLDACIIDDVPVYRRYGGGCSVVLDPGNIIVSIAMPQSQTENIRRIYSELTGWLIKCLEASGLKGVYRDGYCDIVIDNRKIAGCSLCVRRGYTYFTASILAEPDISLMDKYLRHPPREPAYRKGRQHSEFVTSAALVCKNNSFICELINNIHAIEI